MMWYWMLVFFSDWLPCVVFYFDRRTCVNHLLSFGKYTLRNDTLPWAWHLSIIPICVTHIRCVALCLAITRVIKCTQDYSSEGKRSSALLTSTIDVNSLSNVYELCPPCCLEWRCTISIIPYKSSIWGLGGAFLAKYVHLKLKKNNAYKVIIQVWTKPTNIRFSNNEADLKIRKSLVLWFVCSKFLSFV